MSQTSLLYKRRRLDSSQRADSSQSQSQSQTQSQSQSQSQLLSSSQVSTASATQCLHSMTDMEFDTQTTQPMSSGTSSTPSQDRVCSVCRQSYRSFDENQWISCGQKNCGLEYHVTCVGLNSRVRHILMKSKSIRWSCHVCVDRESLKSRRLIDIV